MSGKRTIANAERNAKIIALWVSGMSSNEIHVELGVTRNAVMGALSRYRERMAKEGKALPVRTNLSNKQRAVEGNQNSIKEKKRYRPKKPTIEEQAKKENNRRVWLMPLSKEPAPMSKRLTSFVAVTGCRYLERDEFCDKEQVHNSSWCAEHYVIVHQPRYRSS